jgi:hypothetical protein
MSLKESFAVLTNSFVDGILAAVHDATFADLASFAVSASLRPTGSMSVMVNSREMKIPLYDGPVSAKKSTRKSGRLTRRTPEQIADAVNTVATLLRNHPAGLRSEQIRAELGMDVRELPRVLKEGIADRTLRVLSGQKRSTLYICYATHPAAIAAAKKATKKVLAKKTAKQKAPAKKTPVKAAKSKTAKKAAKKAS